MLPLSAAAFFASGFAALLYQVIWQRLLVLFSGADLYSVTIIVASFMGGMGVGHLVGGQVADRVSPRRRSVSVFSTSSTCASEAISCTSAASMRCVPRRCPRM